MRNWRSYGCTHGIEVEAAVVVRVEAILERVREEAAPQRSESATKQPLSW